MVKAKLNLGESILTRGCEHHSTLKEQQGDWGTTNNSRTGDVRKGPLLHFL